MEDSVLRIFRSDFKLLGRLLTRFSIYGTALLLADAVLAQLRSNIFPNYYDLSMALLIAPVTSVVLAVFLYAVIAAFPVKVLADGIRCSDALGRFRTVKWADISEVGHMNMFGLRYLLVHIPAFKHPIAIPIFLEGLPDFIHIIETQVGANHRLVVALNKVS
jgi:hypothetical protein